jgi:hypothetical protein
MLSRWNMEIASLYGKRMQEYCMLPFNLMLRVSPDDLADAQDDFSETLLADYRAAAEKLTDAFGAGTRKTSGNEATEAYAAVLLKAQEDARNMLDQARAQAQRIINDAEARAAGAQAGESETRAA